MTAGNEGVHRDPEASSRLQAMLRSHRPIALPSITRLGSSRACRILETKCRSEESTRSLQVEIDLDL